MARIFVTGSSDGLALMAAKLLIEQGRQVVLHGRNDVGAGTLSRQQAVPGEPFPGPLHRSRRKDCCRGGQQARSIRRCNSQCRYRLPRNAAGGDASGSARRLCRQCAGTIHTDSAYQTTGSAGLCQLRHAPRRTAANGRSALGQASLERPVGLRGEQALRCPARIRRCQALEGRPIQRLEPGWVAT